MGTRNLTIVRLGGKVKVAQYCQWDGYPAGQGTVIANFLQNKLNLRKLKSKVSKLKFISDKEVGKLWETVGADESGMVSMDISKNFKTKYPYLHRDIGGHILEIIQDGSYEVNNYTSDFKQFKVPITGIEVIGLKNEINFLKDDTFCEYAYELDLDKKIVKVYAGETKPFKTFKFKDFTVVAMKDLEKELQKRYER